MTNGHIIPKELIGNKEEIEVFYNNELNTIKICLNKNERFIKDYRYMDIDAIIIEILPEDNIKTVYYLLGNFDYVNNFYYLDEGRIYTILFNKDSSIVEDKIKLIEKYKFLNNSNSNLFESGFPIFLFNTSLVIGIYSKENSKQFGYFIGPIIYSLIEQFGIIKYDKYYYEGNIINNKPTGYGEYFFENGLYYRSPSNLIDGNFYYQNNLLNVKNKFKLEFIKEKEEFDFPFSRFRKLDYIFSNGYYYIENILENFFFFYCLYNNKNTLLFYKYHKPQSIFILENSIFYINKILKKNEMHNKDLYEKYDFTKGGELLKSRNFIFKDNINYNNFLNTLIKTKEIFLFEENFLCQGYFLVIYEDFYFFIKPNKTKF